MNKELLEKMISEKMINVNKHEKSDIFIYNYTPTAQYSGTWNEITLMCRGLMLDSNLNIIQRPFSKFFNLGERSDEVFPNESFEVYDKMDGSLGILYWVGEFPYIATRGSFTSDQAKKGTDILYRKYPHTFDNLDRAKTYLFEIIYPENRIVVDYGTTEDLILLAIIDTQTGVDCELVDIGFPIVKKYDGIKDLSKIKEIQEDNKEGFVIKFSGGLRFKVKFEEYVRLHKIITQCSNVIIWEHLSQNLPLDDILNKIPDEFYNWVKQIIQDLEEQFDTIFKECKQVFKELPTRKETAEYFKTQKYPNILFAMLDKKDIDSIVWKSIRPTYQKPFNTNLEIG